MDFGSSWPEAGGHLKGRLSRYGCLDGILHGPAQHIQLRLRLRIWRRQLPAGSGCDYPVQHRKRLPLPRVEQRRNRSEPNYPRGPECQSDGDVLRTGERKMDRCGRRAGRHNGRGGIAPVPVSGVADNHRRYAIAERLDVRRQQPQLELLRLVERSGQR